MSNPKTPKDELKDFIAGSFKQFLATDPMGSTSTSCDIAADYIMQRFNRLKYENRTNLITQLEAKKKDEEDSIICHHDERRGLLISSPPKYLCTYCGNSWIYETKAPVCPVLRKAYDAGIDTAIEVLRSGV
jgi:hypothetical protein